MKSFLVKLRKNARETPNVDRRVTVIPGGGRTGCRKPHGRGVRGADNDEREYRTDFNYGICAGETLNFPAGTHVHPRFPPHPPHRAAPFRVTLPDQPSPPLPLFTSSLNPRGSAISISRRLFIPLSSPFHLALPIIVPRFWLVTL